MSTSDLIAGEARRLDPQFLTSRSDILSCISAYEAEEAEVSSSLTRLLISQEPVAQSLQRLRSLGSELSSLQHEATLLCNRVSNTAKTAERVGNRVRLLDSEMGRVREAGDHVGQVMELKSSLVDLQHSIDSRDWESAARHCARALDLPTEIVSGPFAESTVPTAEMHLGPSQTIKAAREQLLAIIRQNFEEASSSRNSTATSRFFKLFPAIGCETEGVDVYSSFVVDLIRDRLPSPNKTSSPLYYVNALTALFESIAVIVDQHQPVVDKYYGPGKMITVVQRLLEECDRVTQSLCSGWEEDRDMDRKMRGLDRKSSMTSHQSHGRRQNVVQVQESELDPRDIDMVLSEIASMLSRWSLFRKFISEAFKENVPESDDDAGSTSNIMSVLASTTSHGLFEKLTTTYYLPLESWYTHTVVEKANRLASTDTTQLPLVTTAPDDVFYILKSVTTRLFSTGSLICIEHSLERLREMLIQDYLDVVRKKLDDIFHGPTPTNVNARERMEHENRNSFITYLNDLDISSSHLESLTRNLAEAPAIGQYFSESEQPIIQDHITNFASLVGKFQSTSRAGVEHLFNHLLRSRLRNAIPETYKDVSYVLDDSNFAVAEYQDFVRKRLTKAWQTAMLGFKDALSDSNYQLFFRLALDAVVRPWEKLVLSMKFTELGAIRFDRDLRSLVMFLSSELATGQARESFSRLQQISTLLNLESDEDVNEFYEESDIPWKFSLHEARVIVELRA